MSCNCAFNGGYGCPECCPPPPSKREDALRLELDRVTRERDELRREVAQLKAGDADLSQALDRLHQYVSFDARDWSCTARDACIYAIVVGWEEAMPDVARKFRWSQEDMATMERLNSAVDSHKSKHRRGGEG